jgi:hypothetical protein
MGRWFAVLAFLWAGSLWADDVLTLPTFASGSKIVMIVGDGVRLRSGDSTDAAVQRTLKNGELAALLESSKDPQKIGRNSYYWQHLQFGDGTRGWVFGQFVFEGAAGAKTNTSPYVSALVLEPYVSDLRDYGGSVMLPALIGPKSLRGFLLKAPSTTPKELSEVGGWLAFDEDLDSKFEIESVSGDADTVEMVFTKKESDNGWVLKARIKLTLQFVASELDFEVTKVERLAIPSPQ